MAVTREQLEAWLLASCADQGVPVVVSDPSVIADVVTLLGPSPVGSGGR